MKVSLLLEFDLVLAQKYFLQRPIGYCSTLLRRHTAATYCSANRQLFPERLGETSLADPEPLPYML